MTRAIPFALGVLCGAALALLLTQPATSRQASTSRPAVVTPLAIGIGAMGTPAADRGADPPAPSPPAVVASPTPRPEAEPAPLESDLRAGGRPALSTPGATPTKRPVRPVERLRGTSTWYAYREGQAAAGPRLRAALGSGWRGSLVTVTGTNGNAVSVYLTDYMGTRNRDKVIDLDAGLFVRICGALSLGVCEVEIRW